MTSYIIRRLFLIIPTVFVALSVLFIIFFMLFVPETKGVSLEKIERNLMSGLPLRKIGR